MWKEGKKRRTIIGKMNNNLSMPTKRPDQDVLKRFREVPYLSLIHISEPTRP